MAGVVWSGLREFEAAIARIVDAVDGATSAAVQEAAHLVESEAKTRSPVKTGSNRRSIYVDGPQREGLTSYSAKVGPSMIYSRRLELGFDGADSRGRVYHQHGRPFLRPGLEAATEQFNDVFARHWGAAVESAKG